jgi:hypothetical protein
VIREELMPFLKGLKVGLKSTRDPTDGTLKKLHPRKENIGAVNRP